MEPTDIARAREAYNAYNAGGDPATANKNFRGEPCPEWDDLPQNVRDKWVAAMKPSADTLDGACRWRDETIARLRAVVEALCESDVGLPIMADGPPLALQALWSIAKHYESGCSFAKRPDKEHATICRPVRWNDFTFQPGGCFVITATLDDSVVIDIDGVAVALPHGSWAPAEHPVCSESRQMVAQGFTASKALIEQALLKLHHGDVSERTFANALGAFLNMRSATSGSEPINVG